MALTPQKVQKARQVFETYRKGKLWTPRNKVLAALALLYLLSPFDLLPDWVVPVVGWLDDLGVLAAVALWIGTHRDRLPAMRDKSAEKRGGEKKGEASSEPQEEDSTLSD